MKKTSTILVMIFLAVTTFGQNKSLFHSQFELESFNKENPHQILFAVDSDLDHTKYNEYFSELNEITSKLESKKERWSDSRIIEKLFYTVHRKQLKWYENYSSFADIFDDGSFDCVSGTALLALNLDYLGYTYEIHEFDYHTLLTIQLADKTILLESTDPLYGFVTNEEEIARRIAVYSTGGVPANSDEISPVGSKSETLSTHINNKISLLELSGLQYFNLAVDAYNKGNRPKAAQLIEKAYMLYPSERIGAIRKIFANPRLVSTTR